MRRCLQFLLFVIISIAGPSFAGEKACHGHFVNPITDICWSCIFPISIGPAQPIKSKLPDTKNSKKPICHCPGRVIPGVALGFWEPTALVDIVRAPYCMANLGGWRLSANKKRHWGTASKGSGSVYQAHWYHFPILSWLGILTDGVCLQKTTDFDVMYLSELDPTWQSDTHNILANPEAVLFATKQAQAACILDAAKTTEGKLPIDSMPWCSGAQGSTYPLNGAVSSHIGGVQASFLLAQRLNLKLHHAKAIRESGPSLSAMCTGHYPYFTPKSRYRFQLVNPVANTKVCMPSGQSTVPWEGGYEYPYKGEDFGYLVWKKRNCCAL